MTADLRADEDLIDIWTGIAIQERQAADRVLDAIEVRWQRLARHPNSGIARDDVAPGSGIWSPAIT